MSTIQAQADELRELAGDGSMEWVIGPIRASALREVADTILSLRDRAQELQGENAELREELEAVGTAAYLYGRDDLKTENAKLREDMEDLEGYDQMLRDRLRQETELQAKAEAENDRLRELVRDWWSFAVGGADSLSDWNAQQADLESHMRELGIEVE